MTVQNIFGVDLGLSVATHKPRSPREVTRLAVFSAQTPQWLVKDKDPEGWRGQNLIIFLTSVIPWGHHILCEWPGKVNKDNIAKGLTVDSSSTLLISETWMEACNRSLSPSRQVSCPRSQGGHWCISSSWLAVKEIEKGGFCPFLRCHLLVRCLLILGYFICGDNECRKIYCLG
jgi:hypothetical protein